MSCVKYCQTSNLSILIQHHLLGKKTSGLFCILLNKNDWIGRVAWNTTKTTISNNNNNNNDDDNNNNNNRR